MELDLHQLSPDRGMSQGFGHESEFGCHHFINVLVPSWRALLTFRL
jgi:hypothetical protein